MGNINVYLQIEGVVAYVYRKKEISIIVFVSISNLG